MKRPASPDSSPTDPADLARLERQLAEIVARESRARTQATRDFLDLQERLAAQGSLIAQRGEELRRLGEERTAAEARIRAMQTSLSWRITAPLRLLRRALIDPWR